MMTYPPIKIKTRCVKLAKLRKAFTRVRRDAPVVMEILMALFILCILLILDVLWLGHAHRKEINLILDDHSQDIGKFKKQFDTQIHQVNQLHEKEGHQLLEKHSEEVNRIKVQHQQEMEKKISNIQKELNNLMGLSKEYWEKHELEMDHQHADKED